MSTLRARCPGELMVSVLRGPLALSARMHPAGGHAVRVRLGMRRARRRIGSAVERLLAAARRRGGTDLLRRHAAAARRWRVRAESDEPVGLRPGVSLRRDRRLRFRLIERRAA
jgi:hypothetical protein